MSFSSLLWLSSLTTLFLSVGFTLSDLSTAKLSFGGVPVGFGLGLLDAELSPVVFTLDSSFLADSVELDFVSSNDLCY